MGHPRPLGTIGTSQFDWKFPINITTGFCTANAAMAASTYAHLVSTPATVFASGLFWIPGGEKTNQIALKFFGAGANDATFIAYMWAIRTARQHISNGPEVVEWFGDHVATFTNTLGTAAINLSTRLLPTPGLWADTIGLTVDGALQGWNVYADSANGTAVVVGDRAGASSLLVGLNCNSSATGAGFMWAEL